MKNRKPSTNARYKKWAPQMGIVSAVVLAAVALIIIVSVVRKMTGSG